MRPANFYDVPKFFGLGFERGVQFHQSRDQLVLQLFGTANVDRRGNHVVARLPHVHMIVRMHRVVRSDRLTCQLRRAIRDDFIGISVRARARAGLKNVERKMFVEFSLSDFFGRLRDHCCPVGVEQAEILIRLRSRPFD
jgi:hypothetical protein